MYIDGFHSKRIGNERIIGFQINDSVIAIAVQAECYEPFHLNS